MNLKSLETLVKTGESEILEFKKSSGTLKAAFKTICAFLNSNGGTVLIGVFNDGKIVGQDVTDKTQLELANMMQNIEPNTRIHLDFIPINHGDKRVISLHVDPVKGSGPFFFDGKAYERIAASTHRMKHERLQSLFSEKIQNTTPWERWFAEGISYENLHEKEILKFYHEALHCGRARDKTIANDPKDILLGFGMLSDDQKKITNAAVVLFGKKFLPNYPQCTIKLIKFNGLDKRNFLDNKKVTGNLFELLEEAMNFVHRNMKITSQFTEGQYQRKDIPEFPPLAIREAVINALTHRDYSQANGYVEIGLYDDRIEIASLGELPAHMHLDLLRKKHKSIPRNQIIADVVYTRGLVEQLGRGTNIILEECKVFDLPEPEFLMEHGFFQVTMFSTLQAHMEFAEDVLDGIKLTDRQKKILEILYKNDRMQTSDITTSFQQKTTQRTIQRDLSYLEQCGLVKQKGIGRSTQWELTAKMKKSRQSRHNRDNHDKLEK